MFPFPSLRESILSDKAGRVSLSLSLSLFYIESRETLSLDIGPDARSPLYRETTLYALYRKKSLSILCVEKRGALFASSGRTDSGSSLEARKSLILYVKRIEYFSPYREE